jgi:hypothetical protein
MAITINGTGSITGLTAGGLPDGSVTNADLEYTGTSGQVLTSQGSGSAPQWATLPAGGYTFLAAGTVSGNASVTVTGIPTSAQQIIIPFRSMSNNEGTARKIKLNVGSGSVDTGSNYTYSVGAEGVGFTSANNQNHYLVTPTAFTGAANVFDGMVWITRIGTNEWAIVSIAAETGNNNPPSYGGGRYFGANTIDRVQLSCNAGTYDSGEFRVGYI